MAYRSGKRGRATCGGTSLKLTEADVTYRGDDLDTTSFEDNGHETGVTGVDGLDVNFKGNWDHQTVPVSDPPGLYPRDDLASVLVYPNTTDGARWSMDLARVLSTKNTIPVRGVVTFESSLKSNGDFTAIA